MEHAERFQVVIEELRLLLTELADQAHHVVLVGGQVIALESLARGGSGTIRVETRTGIAVDRGFSMEPDLLFDTDSMQRYSDEVPRALRARQFERVRDHSWRKEAQGYDVTIDLFRPPEAADEYVPTGMTKLPAAQLALARPRELCIRTSGGNLEIAVPDALGVMATKAAAKLKLRPRETNDCFDLYAYAFLRTPAEIAKAFRGRGQAASDVLNDLKGLFGTIASPGVADVLAIQPHLGPDERELLARAVVDLFDEIQQLLEE